MVVLSLLFASGCGGGGGGGGGDGGTSGATPTANAPERTPTPLPTSTLGAPTPAETPGGSTPAPSGGAGATPGPTATPGPATTVRVDFAITSEESLLGFQLTVLYPTARGSFGSGAQVDCPLGASGIFVKNDQGDGHLLLAAIDLSPYPGAFNLSCTFGVGAGQVLTPADLGVTVTEVTRPDGTMGDPSEFTVAVSVN